MAKMVYGPAYSGLYRQVVLCRWSLRQVLLYTIRKQEHNQTHSSGTGNSVYTWVMDSTWHLTGSMHARMKEVFPTYESTQCVCNSTFFKHG